MFPIEPNMAKELVEERQREMLEDAEAEELVDGDAPADEYQSDNYRPVSDTDHDLVKTPKHNRHIHGDEVVGGE